MNIRWVTSMLSLLLVVTSMGTAALSWSVYDAFRKMIEADVQYQGMLQISHELLQSSYDLTRRVREYVNTGDPAAEAAYYAILDERQGKVPRKAERAIAAGESISMMRLLKRYGASGTGVAFLESALKASDDLAQTEIEAMRAIKGKAECPDGLHSGVPDADVTYARDLLFSPLYRKEAQDIVTLVNSGISGILSTKVGEIVAYERSVLWSVKALAVSIGFVFLIAMVWGWYGSRRISLPLQETTRFARRVAEGEDVSSIAVKGHDEIAELRAMLNVMLENLKKNARMLRELSYVDPLTALWNRRRFREVLADELRRVQSEGGTSFGLAFIDIDSFKIINDTYGHAAGDMVLRQFAKIVRRHIPDSVTFARLGGDEFVLLLPETDEETLRGQLERLRKACEDTRLTHAERPIRLNISAGGYVFRGVAANADTPEEVERLISDLFRYADTALYASKQEGRNRVTLWHPGCSLPCSRRTACTENPDQAPSDDEKKA